MIEGAKLTAIGALVRMDEIPLCLTHVEIRS